MEDMNISTKKGVTYFNDEEGIILELDTKAVQGYLKAIRSHYKERLEEKIDISTGIRKAVKRLTVKISQSIIDDVIKTNKKPQTKKRKREDLKYCENLNHLNTLYEECQITQITQNLQKCN
jgi:hypothetical protein